MSIDYIWNGLKSAPQPAAKPCLGLDYADSILYVASQPTPTSPSVWVPIGGGPNGGPVIEAGLQVVNATTPESVTITSLATTMYAVSLFLESAGTALSGHEVIATLTWGSPVTDHTITLTLPLDSAQVIMETYPLLVAANAPITIQSEYAGGATNDPYTISARLVVMP
jgi:hypothetical protein